MKLLKTGIPGFDELLRGGLPPNVILLLGSSGSGSEVFAEQVLYNRALEGEVTYFTVHKPPELIKDEMTLYGWNVSLLKEGSWRFGNLGRAKSLGRVVSEEIKQRRWVVVDSLSELLLTYGIQEIIALLKSMSSDNRESEGLHFLLLTEGMQDSKLETTLEHFADGVISFTVAWETEILSRRMTIKKIRGALVPARSLLYSVGETGLTIETARRIT